MPQQLGEGNCQYTALSTAGTTTITQQPEVGQVGVCFGLSQVSAGTGFGATLYDIAVQGTATTTTPLVTGTGTAGQSFQAGVPGVGVRYKGSLVAVAVGTPGETLALWD